MIKIKNLKDLKDVAKTITKEEFLKSDYVLSDNNGICPNFIGLLNRDCDNGNDDKYECVKCTIKAIEDNNIKFKDNIEIEKPQGYLISTVTNNTYGNIGEETILQDVNGKTLYVGDIVEVFHNNKKRGIAYCCKDEDTYFPMGARAFCDNGKMADGWSIKLLKRWYKLKNGKIVNRIKFVQTNNINKSINIKVDMQNIDKTKNEILTLQAENLKLKNIIKELIKLNNNMTNQLKMGDDIVD